MSESKKRELSWPTALVLLGSIGAVVGTVLGGPAAGLDGEQLALVLGAEGVLASSVLAVMRALLGGE